MMRRRHVLQLIGAGATLSLLPPLAWGQDGASRKRLVLVILRGALDALHAVPPLGDPNYARIRGEHALGRGERGALKLNADFGLHPALAGLHRSYGAGEALVFTAVATPYRERSHFDAQDVLEGGGAAPKAHADGWLNRALQSQGRRGDRGVAIAPELPLVLRGGAGVANWAPSELAEPNADYLERVAILYRDDPAMAQALERARAVAAGRMDSGDGEGKTKGLRAVTLAQAAARFLTKSGGHEVAVLELGGWDSHFGQFSGSGQLERSLRTLDQVLATLREGLGAMWKDSVVYVVTEFGRTVQVNGTGGTDHGTGAAAFAVGGAVRGGRVLGQWPGLDRAALLEARDLRPTTDLRSVSKGLLLEHLGVPESALARVFPGSESVRPLTGLVA